MAAASAPFSYPVFLNLSGRLAVVVGAGSVGRRKVAGLLHAGALIRLVDPSVAAADAPGETEFLPRAFRPDDLQGAALAFACTDSAEVNAEVIAAAQRLGVLCCRADQPNDGDFVLPALFRQGPLTVAVSSGGGSPALAAEMRDRLQKQTPDYWGISLEIMTQVRRKWLTLQEGDQYNHQILRRFWAEQLLPLLEQGSRSEINQLLVDTFGKEFALEQLPLRLPEGML